MKDRGTPHLVAYSGGTAFNWLTNRNAYITADRPASFWFESYRNSAQKFRDIAAKAGADVVISNHLDFDGSKTKLPAILARKTGDPHPYVVGKDGVQRYLTVGYECSSAGLLQSRVQERPQAQQQGGGGFNLGNLRHRWSRKA